MEQLKLNCTDTAVFLLARGHRLVGTVRTGRQVSFCFNDLPKVRNDMEQLKFGDDSVSARTIFSARNRIVRVLQV